MSARPCVNCGRPALYFRRVNRRGHNTVVVRAGGAHTLCNRCFRDEQNRSRALGLDVNAKDV